jgi:hypothetical protein
VEWARSFLWYGFRSQTSTGVAGLLKTLPLHRSWAVVTCNMIRAEYADLANFSKTTQ